jgi:DNA-binding MarR family transcriptional regulator
MKATPSRAVCAEEKAFVEMVRTVEELSRPVVAQLKQAALSRTQYNVLRILRGAPDGLACGEIAIRMITRDPDITRLLDRLEARALISRCRENEDRRQVLTRIAPAGLALLARLDEPIRDTHRKLLGHLGSARLRELFDLLQACRRAEPS